MPVVELPSSFEEQKMEALRKRVVDHHSAVGEQTKEKFQDVLAELFFLQNGGNMMDYIPWKRKPPASYFEFMKMTPLEIQVPGDMKFSNPNATDSAVIKTSAAATPNNSNTSSTASKSMLLPSKSPSISLPGGVRVSVQHPHPGRPPNNPMSNEQMVEKAKQEAHVYQRIAELQRDGLWSEKRLPKVAEPARPKSHWDYLLEEMVWLAADFAQERKWKKNSARKCGRMVLKHFQDKAAAAARAEKEEEQKLRKVAAFVAKEIRTFWTNVEKLVEYKQQIRLEEKRKRVLDQHLNFIVNETEKYSSLLTEGLPKVSKEGTPELTAVKPRDSDDDFEPDEICSTDDEETIAQEETLAHSSEGGTQKGREKEEIDALKRESEIPLEDLLDDLPAEYFENMGKSISTVEVKEEKPSDDEFEINSDDDTEDDEETIDQAEREENESRDAELLELEAEKNMPLEKLLAKYSGTSNQELEGSESMTAVESDQNEDSDGSEELSVNSSDSEMDFEDFKDVIEESSSNEKIKEGGLGLESLLDDSLGSQDAATSKLSDAAAIAESFQPKGNTLESTQVIAKLPFLLKHSLREYQHIGMDWMAAMYERKLNGILADEMGLGKTIQTIGLLAWLACEKGVWGPHLVVVPTSVMLNWEMEFKKWCPSFKILTYYGSQKDRRQKRMGWTKPNAFHVCITSYKLVIQDHQAFRRKRWRYFILDEAQNIKNFKSQRWQLLLNFQSQRRLLLTGTPLQNNLMELWSLMHFLMPDIFGSHRDFREWFSNPVTGMIEGNAEYNDSIIRRLHKVLRPFILRRLKCEVEKQMPQKYEHVVMCRLSKRQRYLYDDFMSKARTKETLATGNLLSVINVLMQLRKVCNHPNLFEPRPTVSPFQMDSIVYNTASQVYGILDYDPFKHVNLYTMNLLLADLELTLTAYSAHRTRKFQANPILIQEIDKAPPLPPPCPRGKLHLHVTNKSSVGNSSGGGISISRFPVTTGGSSLSNSEGGVASPQHPKLAAPAPSFHSAIVSSSGAVHPPPNSLLKELPVREKMDSKNNPTEDGRAGFPSRVHVTSYQDGSVGFRSNLRSNVEPDDGNGRSSSASSNAPSSPIPARVGQNGPDSGNHRTPKWSYDRLLFKNNSADEKKRQERRERLAFLAKLNKMKCEACPIWGSDLISAVSSMSETTQHGSVFLECSLEERLWSGKGKSYVNCMHAVESMTGRRNFETLWRETNTLRQIIHTPDKYLDELQDIVQRFVVCTPAVTAPPIVFHTSHPPPSKLWESQKTDFVLKSVISPAAAKLHHIQSGMMTQFPDPRLIQYDCGKLQTLDNLLRQLKSGRHRVLIFTQMTRMLDVLEAFLNYHGHIYLRLDGTTRVDQRQVLMERFNADTRIFCFILSTRSGGVGVNLTGADTVIFYDSDWNPTMDAQAQDRCHRIGQTRDVHIYRLISERTVEENILKKANQKRLLGDIAIEGGNFTAATFKKQTIHDLFEVDVEETDPTKRMAEVLDRPKEDQTEERDLISAVRRSSVSPDCVQPATTNKAALGLLESALAAAEDETDVAAARIVRAEAAAEMDEFDESAPVQAEDGENGVVDAEINKAEAELLLLENQLTPVERYALKFMETSEECWSAEQLRAAEAQIEEQKRAWELKRLAALSGNDDERAIDDCGAVEPGGGLLTYSHQDAVNQVKTKPGRPRNRNKIKLNKVVVTPSPGPSNGDCSTTGKSRRRLNNHHDLTNSFEFPEDFSVIKESESPQVKIESSMSEATDCTPSATPPPNRLKRKRVLRKSVTSQLSLNDSISDLLVTRSSTKEVDLPIVTSSAKALSPRTRSRGTVNINLWTLDARPLIPAVTRGTPSPKLAQNKIKDRCSPCPTTTASVNELILNGCSVESEGVIVPNKKSKLVVPPELKETEHDLDVVS